MAVFNLRRKEVHAKIVYYGPGLSGKTTNLQHIHQKLKPEHKGKLMTLATQQDRTLFFDFLPVELGEIRGLKTRFQLYTVPGQVFYNSTRKLVLKNVDGVVFVADSRAEALRDNLDSLANLQENLKVHRLNLRETPLVIQYNKRDLPTALPIAELERQLNPRGVPTHAAEAQSGTGVLETLSAICKLVLKNLREKDPAVFGSGDERVPGVPAERAAPAAATAAPAAVQAASAPPQAATGGWRLRVPEAPVELVEGELHVPIALERDGETVELRVRVALEPLAR